MKLNASELNVPTTTGDSSNLVPIVNGVLYIAGAVCVIVLIIAGINYATASGDAGKIARAKSMILYAVIGLLVIMCSFALVQFILGQF